MGTLVRFLLVALVVTFSGCGRSDLGAPCTLIVPTAGGGTAEFIPPSSSNDYVSTGPAECENFTCLDSANDDDTAYCTKRCNEDAQCRGGLEKGLVCRELVLDQSFIEELRQTLGEERFLEVFGDIQNARYCARELPE